jgi:hypothetical protein
LYYELVILMCYLCDIYCIMNFLYWFVYRSYSRFRPLPVYFPYRTFISEVFEISILFSFPKLPFSISIPIKNMETIIVLVFTDRFPTIFIHMHDASLPTRELLSYLELRSHRDENGAKMLSFFLFYSPVEWNRMIYCLSERKRHTPINMDVPRTWWNTPKS